MARGLKIDVRVDGLTKARETVALLPQAFKDVAIEALEIGSRIILSEAGRRVPVRFGKLKASLGRNVRSDGLQIAVGSGDKKARFVEFATNDTPAQPFLYPGFRLGSRFIRASMKDWPEEAGIRARAKTKLGRKPKKRVSGWVSSQYAEPDK